MFDDELGLTATDCDCALIQSPHILEKIDDELYMRKGRSSALLPNGEERGEQEGDPGEPREGIGAAHLVASP